MKVLGISGSPRKNSNTEKLVAHALKICKDAGFETELIALSKMKIGYCTACDACKPEPHRCPIKDDVPKIFEAMESADAIIIGSPTYFSSISGQLKVLFDRTLPLRRAGSKLSGKVGGAIAVGRSRNGGQEFVASQIMRWFLLHEMIVVADKETAHFGGIAVEKDGDAMKDQIGVKTVGNLARKVVEVLKKC